jgi:hypothetical protein
VPLSTFIISKRYVSYRVEANDSSIEVTPLPPYYFSLDTYNTLARSLQALGCSFLTKQRAVFNSHETLMNYYQEQGYHISNEKIEPLKECL